MPTLRKNISQVGYPKAGDIDDCWAVASLTCLWNIARDLRLPDMRVFREAAGNPDEPNISDGGNVFQIARAFQELYPKMPFQVLYLRAWADFAALMRGTGRVASVAVTSSKLPSGLRYGFNGAHQCAVEWTPDGWILLNPLAKTGTTPQRVGAATLRTAMQHIGGGNVIAVVLDPPTIKEYFAMNVFTKDGRKGSFRIPPNTTIKGFRWGSGGWEVAKTMAKRTTAVTGKFDFVLRRTAGTAVPSNALHVVGGFFDGLYVPTGSVEETFDPVVTTYTQQQLDATVAEVKATVKRQLQGLAEAI